MRWQTKDGERKGYRARVLHNGKRVPAPVRETVDDAQADVAEIRAKAQFLPADVLTFRRAVDQALDAMLARGVKQGTLDWFANHRKKPEKYFDTMLLHRLGHGELDAYFSWRKRTSSTLTNNGLQHDRRFLMLVLRHSYKRGALLRDPTLGYQWPKAERHPPRFLLPEEFGALLQRIRKSGKASAGRDAAIIAILANTGARLSEFARLRVCDVNTKDRMLAIAGKRGPRMVELRGELLPHFNRLLDGRDKLSPGSTDYLLPPFTETGIEPTPKRTAAAIAHDRRREQIVRSVERWSRKLDEKRLHPHAMRHTCGVALAIAGKSIPQIMGLLGVTARMAEHYSNLVAAMRGKGFEGIGLAT